MAKNEFIQVEPLRSAFASYLDINVDERSQLRPSVGTRISSDAPSLFHVTGVKTNPRVTKGGGGLPPRNVGIYLDCGPYATAPHAKYTHKDLLRVPHPPVSPQNRASMIARDAPNFFKVPGAPLSEKQQSDGVWSADYTFDAAKSSKGREVSYDAPESFHLGGKVPVGSPGKSLVLLPTRATTPTTAAASRTYAQRRARDAAARRAAKRKAAHDQRIESQRRMRWAGVKPLEEFEIRASYKPTKQKQRRSKGVSKKKKQSNQSLDGGDSINQIMKETQQRNHRRKVMYSSGAKDVDGSWFMSWQAKRNRRSRNKRNDSKKTERRPIMGVTTDLLSNGTIGGGMWL